MDPNMVRILGSADTWLKDLPDNHGKLMHLVLFPSWCERSANIVILVLRTVNYGARIVQLSVSKVVA